MSPTSNIIYSKGDTALIQAEIRREDTLIDNAIVNCKSPSGSIFQLKEISQGLYSEYYNIKFTDPTGIWSITCEVQKIEEGKTFYGGSFVNVKIDPAILKIDLINPKENELKYGEKADFIVNLTYPNNEPVSSATVLLNFQGQNLALLDVGKGIYKTAIQTKNVGRFNVTINANDLNDNRANLEKTFTVKATLLGFLYINWYIIPLSLGCIISVLYTFRYYSMRVPNQIKECEKKLGQIKDEMRSTQIEYFNRKIDEKTFGNTMEKLNQKKIEYQVRLRKLYSALGQIKTTRQNN
jgi:hypothetical protein